MGEFHFRRLERFKVGGTSQNMKLSIPLPETQMGKVLRYCPNDLCVPRRFQLGGVPDGRTISAENAQIVRRTPGANGSTCPYCGTDGDDDDYVAPEDIAAAEDVVRWTAEQDIGDWMENLAKDFNQRAGRGGFITMKMETKRTHRPAPRPWRRDLLRDLTCNVCQRRYGTYAIAFFCPDCGARNLSVHFQREVELVTGMIDMAEELPIPEAQELSFRLLGNAHEDVVTAFESYLKSIFRFVITRRLSPEQLEVVGKESRGNPFQNIDRARNLFRRVELDPFSCLDSGELEGLGLNIEKRHVIGHNLGLADERYVEVAQEGSLGENVSLLGDEIERFAVLCAKVINYLEVTLQEFLPPGKS